MKRILLGLAFGVIMMAQPGRPGYGPNAYNDRGAYAYTTNNFAERITRGERMGLITRNEAARLWTMERNLRREIAQSARDGFGVSGRERDKIARMSANLDREITRQTRDRENYRGGRW